MIRRTQLPNAACMCGSGKKHKKCCMWKAQDQMTAIKTSARVSAASPEAIAAATAKKEAEKQESSTSEIMHVMQGWLTTYTLKDVTSSLMPDTYTYLQQEFARTKRVLVARRTPASEPVFEMRANGSDISDIDHIVMYNGHYWLIDSNCLQQYRVDLCSKIRKLDSK